jgi:hypothetical protein
MGDVEHALDAALGEGLLLGHVRHADGEGVTGRRPLEGVEVVRLEDAVPGYGPAADLPLPLARGLLQPGQRGGDAFHVFPGGQRSRLPAAGQPLGDDPLRGLKRPPVGDQLGEVFGSYPVQFHEHCGPAVEVGVTKTASGPFWTRAC